jgi:hypothetical protein
MRPPQTPPGFTLVTALRTSYPETMSHKPSKPAKPSALPGIAAMGLVLNGALSMYHAFHTGSPIGLVAAALSFGVILVVSFL